MPFFAAPLFFFITIAVELYYGNFFFLLWVAYVLLPLIDYFMVVDNDNLQGKSIRKFEKDWRFLIPLYTVVLLDFALYASMLIRVSRGTVGATSFSELMLYALCSA